jgi:hypothetical protein
VAGATLGRGHLVLRVPRAPRRGSRAAPGEHAADRPGRTAATSYKPFLQHATTGKPQCHRTIKLKAARRRPAVLTAAEAQTILDACEHLRDRLLFATLLDTGCGPKIGPGRTGPEVSPGRPDRHGSRAVGTERSPFAQVRRCPVAFRPEPASAAERRPASRQRSVGAVFGTSAARRRVTPGRGYLTRYKGKWAIHFIATPAHGDPPPEANGAGQGLEHSRGGSQMDSPLKGIT